jgi:hypothetical protein
MLSRATCSINRLGFSGSIAQGEFGKTGFRE